jgi:hypothetical protein
MHITEKQIWTEKVQRAYVFEAFNIYKKKCGDPTSSYSPRSKSYWRTLAYPLPWDVKHQKDEGLLSELYLIGKATEKIRTLSYKEFESLLLCGPKRTHGGRPYTGKFRDFWYEDHGVGYREKLPKNGHQERTEREKEKKLEWREKKGFQRSRQKNCQWQVGTKARGFSEKTSSRSFRKMEKNKIKKEKWEDLADSNSLSRLYRDNWDWD